MTDPTAAAPLMSASIVEILLVGPSMLPRHRNAEVERFWGRYGERAAQSWREHEAFLRAAAAERGIRPLYPRGKFFAEALQTR